ncbi:hypothetical protein VDG1235_2342 [Verrucomicrobiia bacterium DG1235]|nr:hypothetical protein VDG1235_2342 [Verrucomicrobiae bacterium DG1235]
MVRNREDSPFTQQVEAQNAHLSNKRPNSQKTPPPSSC